MPDFGIGIKIDFVVGIIPIGRAVDAVWIIRLVICEVTGNNLVRAELRHHFFVQLFCRPRTVFAVAVVEVEVTVKTDFSADGDDLHILGVKADNKYHVVKGERQAIAERIVNQIFVEEVVRIAAEHVG